MMSLDTNLTRTVNRAVEALHQGEKFPVPVLAVRAEKAAQANPHDVGIVTASNVLKKMASDNKTFISRKELNDIYERLNAPNSKLADLFAEELDRKPLQGPTFMRRSDFEDSPVTTDYTKVGDSLLINALSTIFDEAPEAKLYSNKDAIKAKQACAAQLLAAGFEPKSVDVFTGQSDFIVCQASYETPKGKSNVLVPVELKEGRALLPTLFLTRFGFVEIAPEALKDHIVSTAGKNFKVDGEKLLNVLASAKYGVLEPVNDVELALMRVNASKETPMEHSINGVLYQQIEDANPNIELPKVALEPEHEAFAKRLVSPAGLAKHMFGDRLVTAGANMLTRKMYEFGFGHTQIAVAGVEDDTIIYSVAVDRAAGFKVPVKVRDNRVLHPTIAIASGELGEFSKKGLSQLMKEAVVDTRAIAQSSPVYNLKPSELMKQVRDGIAEGNMFKAEDAIDALADVDPDAQKRAIALLIESNNPETIEKVASEQRGCKMVVGSNTSNHPICGHLNLPLHKVYQDKNGDCHPLYRKGMEETNEGGATFMFHKILQY